MAQTTLICPECSFQKVVPRWEDGGNIALCPNCTDVGRSKLQGLMSVEMFVHIEFQKQLQSLIYCRGCRRTHRVETLELDGPSDDLNSETRCPNCKCHNLINARYIKFCKCCGEREARAGLDFCTSCYLDYYALGEDMWDLAGRWADQEYDFLARQRS